MPEKAGWQGELPFLTMGTDCALPLAAATAGILQRRAGKLRLAISDPAKR